MKFDENLRVHFGNGRTMANITAADPNIAQFKLLPQGPAVFLAVLNIFLSITAFLGNALILIVLYKVTSIHPPTKLLFRCLAVTDLCVGLISQPLVCYAILVNSFRLTTSLTVYNYVSKVHIFSTAVLNAVSILTSTAISVDRLLALLLGLRYRHVVTLRRVRAIILIFWLLGFVLGGWMLTHFGNYSALIFIALITICLLTSLFSYTKIYLRLRQHQIQLQHEPQVHLGQAQNGGGIPLNIARYKKTVSSIAWVQLALLACYIPFSIFTILQIFGEVTVGTSLFVVFSFLYLNSSLNPILYCWKIVEVRQAVKDTIRQLNCCS